MSKPRYGWWPYAKWMVRSYKGGGLMTKAERAAVEEAIAETEQLVDGAEKYRNAPVLAGRRIPCKGRHLRAMSRSAPRRSGTDNLFALWGKKGAFCKKVCVPEPNLTFTIRA